MLPPVRVDGCRCWIYKNNCREYSVRYAFKGEAFDET
ncbi:hypothetical protein PSEUDO8BK_40473 [Pseudomonas sp. 8BK]|nr:hypothetical protein PSEUDO8BK_40473 [Pseudomonas sp. 8BK]